MVDEAGIELGEAFRAPCNITSFTLMFWPFEGQQIVDLKVPR